MGTKITAIQLAVCQGKLAAIRLLAQCGEQHRQTTDDDDGNKAVHLTAERPGGRRWELGADLSAALVPPRASVQLMSANNSSVCVNGFTPLQ
jgi:hypothetical protein